MAAWLTESIALPAGGILMSRMVGNIPILTTLSSLEPSVKTCNVTPREVEMWCQIVDMLDSSKIIEDSCAIRCIVSHIALSH